MGMGVSMRAHSPWQICVHNCPHGHSKPLKTKTPTEAKIAEADLAKLLEQDGYVVEGGH